MGIGTVEGLATARRMQVAADLRSMLARDAVIDDPIALAPYEADAFTTRRQAPMLAALPASTAEVSAVLKYCHEHAIKVVPRGAGTSLSGGSHGLADGITLGLAKLNRILKIDYENRCAVVQPGVTNLGVSNAVDGAGFYYAPDPSSQLACTIGGNVAENSGGVHCLKYGLTTNNILGLELVLMTGEVVRIGGTHLDPDGYDLLGILVGSEGLLGIVTEVTVRILPKPSHVRAMLIGFPTIEDAGDCVARIIGAGIIPAGMEMMDQAAVHAAENFVKAGYPLNVAALLILELDGPVADIDQGFATIRAIAESARAISCLESRDDNERMKFWAGRKAAFPAVASLAPDYYCMDGTIPRYRLADVLRRIEEMSEQCGLAVVNVFHAGDGNLHPLILFDANKPGELAKAETFGEDILRLCVDVGGVLTGEHGVGVEKRDLMPLMFSQVDLDQQMRLKCAFDTQHLLNPDKVFPNLKRCAELGRVHIHHGKMRFADLPRF